MATRNNLRGLLLIVTLAFLGFLLIAVPSFLVNQFKEIKDPTWATLYGVTVGLGFLLVIGCFLWGFLRLWLATRRKRRQRDLSDKSPSELSPTERNRQIDANLQAVEDLKSDAAVSSELRRELDPLIDEIVKADLQTLLAEAHPAAFARRVARGVDFTPR